MNAVIPKVSDPNVNCEWEVLKPNEEEEASDHENLEESLYPQEEEFKPCWNEHIDLHDFADN